MIAKWKFKVDCEGNRNSGVSTCILLSRHLHIAVRATLLIEKGSRGEEVSGFERNEEKRFRRGKVRKKFERNEVPKRVRTRARKEQDRFVRWKKGRVSNQSNLDQSMTTKDRNSTSNMYSSLGQRTRRYANAKDRTTTKTTNGRESGRELRFRIFRLR